MEIILSYWPIAAIVVGAVLFIFLLKYLSKKYVIDAALIKVLLNTLKSFEWELVELFGKDFITVIEIFKDALLAMEDDDLTEDEAYELGMSIVQGACVAADIELSFTQLFVIRFIVRKMAELASRNKADMAMNVLSDMVDRRIIYNNSIANVK